MKRLAILILFLLGCSGIIFYTKSGCVAIDGRWTPKGGIAGTCVTPLCHYAGSCGNWLQPKIACEEIGKDLAYAQLHFLLGEPNTIDGNQYRWTFGKGGGETTVRAQVEDGTVTHIECPADGPKK